MIAHDVKYAGDVLKRFREDMKKQGSYPDMSGEDKAAHLKFLEQRVKDAKNVFGKDVLKPEVDTYLTAEWGEMVPFPTSMS